MRKAKFKKTEESNMKYSGMPMGMWTLFAGSFQKQLPAVFGYDTAAAKAIVKKRSRNTKKLSGIFRRLKRQIAFK